MVIVSTNSLERQKSDCDTFSIDAVKQDYKRVGEHKLLRKTLISLTVGEYYSLQASDTSIDSFLNFFKIQNLKPTLQTTYEKKL